MTQATSTPRRRRQDYDIVLWTTGSWEYVYEVDKRRGWDDHDFEIIFADDTARLTELGILDEID